MTFRPTLKIRLNNQNNIYMNISKQGGFNFINESLSGRSQNITKKN